MKRVYFLTLVLALLAFAFVAPDRFITGTVTDDAGNPVNAYVRLKENVKGMYTNKTGGFKLQVYGTNPVLVITAVGYETREIKISGGDNITVRLHKTNTPETAVLEKEYSLDETLIDEHYTKSAPLVMNKRASKLLGQSGSIVAVGRGGLQYPSPQDRFYGNMHPGDREGYDAIHENAFVSTSENPLSTFSIDVDAASYSNVRRILNSGRLPDAGAVRIEEMVNYFKYDYKQPVDGKPFSVQTELSECPWNPAHQLMLIGLQGKKVDVSDLPPSNLVFLIDVSGSMMTPDKLPLVQQSLLLLTEQLRPQDKVAIVVYAGQAGLVLPSTSGENKIRIREAINQLEAGGSTAGGAGIQLAYRVAADHFNAGGNNRVVLCTDGDFNVGASSDDALESMIEQKRKTGIFLTVLGYGTGNYQDAKMQKLADKGNGNHAYIDGIGEAKKVLSNEFGGTLFTIAKDVKLQLEFNPAHVKGYRLIGYENRMLAKEDFKNDMKDAGDMGSGHSVTALYELVPANEQLPEGTAVDPLRYQANKIGKPEFKKHTDELLMIKLRYKQPNGEKSSELAEAVAADKFVKFNAASDNLRFAASVASFGMLLRNSEHKGSASYASIDQIASKALGNDKEGYRKEFIHLVNTAERIKNGSDVVFR